MDSSVIDLGCIDIVNRDVSQKRNDKHNRALHYKPSRLNPQCLHRYLFRFTGKKWFKKMNIIPRGISLSKLIPPPIIVSGRLFDYRSCTSSILVTPVPSHLHELNCWPFEGGISVAFHLPLSIVLLCVCFSFNKILFNVFV